MQRGVVLDCARKWYTPDFIFSLLELMGQTKCTHLQLHFSDNEGYRIESNVCKKLVSAKHYTKHEIQQFQEFARARKITIIPEFDSPGHLRHFLTVYPQYRLSEETTSMIPLAHAADVTHPDFVEHVKKLLTEIMELFDASPIVHLGGDEVVDWTNLASLPSTIQEKVSNKRQVDYLNTLARFVEKQGKVARIWNDGCYREDTDCLLKPSIEIAYWTRWQAEMAPVETFLDKGHRVFNYNDNALYFVLGEAAGYNYPTIERLQAFTPQTFAQNQKLTTSPAGVYFSIWGDRPEALTQEQVLQQITPLLHELAKK